MRVGVDVMGGDYAPQATIEGVILASLEVSNDTTIVLYGDEQEILTQLKERGISLNNIEIVNTTEVIGMCDSPTQSFVRKTDSSIVVGFTHLKAGMIDGFASAGSTGAMMVGCVSVIKPIDGVIRPTIATPLPTFNGDDFFLLDVGLNIDCKPEVLSQYGLIGSIYAETCGVENPRVALLNIGEEEEKGNTLTKAAYALMKEESSFNFVGNVESKSIFTGDIANVVVCDGFIGNIVLKTAEGLYPFLMKSAELRESKFLKGFNYETTGGTPVLGIDGVVVIGHGCSSPTAIKNMILQVQKSVASKLVEKIKKAFANEKN